MPEQAEVERDRVRACPVDYLERIAGSAAVDDGVRACRLEDLAQLCPQHLLVYHPDARQAARRGNVAIGDGGSDGSSS